LSDIAGRLAQPPEFEARPGTSDLSRRDVRKLDDGPPGFGKAYELNAGPDDAIRFRSCISHLTRDHHVDGGSELKAHRNAPTQMQSERIVLPDSEKFDWIGVA
jgi:hypothetical protein